MALKVLTVDDSKTIRMIVKKAFRPYDCEIVESENGVEGLAAAGREKPDLIILDITMPVMNGIEMLAKMKGENSLKDIPVIMLTAESGRDNVLKIVKMGVRDYIVKPFKDVDLIERARNIVKLEPRKESESAEDPSAKYFTMDGDIQRLVIPEKVTRPVILEVEGHLQSKIKEMAMSAARNKLILDLRKVTETNVSLIKVIISTVQKCQKSNTSIRILATPTMSSELKEFRETSDMPIDHTVEEAKNALQLKP